MGVIAQYQVSQAFPSVVGGTGATIKYFASNPPQSLWNSGQPGVNSPQSSSQFGNTPSASSALGQLSFDTIAQKLTGGRFRMYASGTASSATTPTITPVVQINTGTIASPSYATFLGGVASAALTANKAVGWSIAGDLYFDPAAGTLSGFLSTRMPLHLAVLRCRPQSLKQRLQIQQVSLLVVSMRLKPDSLQV